MVMNKNILIALDATDASMRAVSYVVEMLGGDKDLRVHLLHVLPPIPPELLEFGGSENPDKEKTLTEELRKDQSEWIERTKKEAEPVFEQARTILGNGGIPASMVQTEFSTSIHRPDIVRDILEAAAKWNCSTVVVGRHSHTWLKEQLGHHVGEDLARRGHRVAVWIIE